MLLIDRYAYNNRLRDFNPFIKCVVVAIALVIATTTQNIYINLSIFGTMVFSTIIIAGIPIKSYMKIFSIPMFFLLLSILAIIISLSKVDVFLWSIRISSYYIGIMEDSIDEAFLLSSRVFASVSSTFFLGLTTPLNHIVRVLKRLHIPSLIIELTVLIYRFIFVFLEEAKEIYNGQEMKFGYTNMKNSLHSVGLLIRSLFTRLLLRNRDMLVVLECKLYDGEFRTGD